MPIPAGVIIGWPSTIASIPSGWSRVAALDGYFIKSIPNRSTTPTNIGGNATHIHQAASHYHTVASHAHTGGWNDSGSGGSQFAFQGGLTVAANGHYHQAQGSDNASGNTDTETPPSQTGSNNPDSIEYIFIESNGVPTQIPAGALVFWPDTTLPGSWTLHNSSKTRFPKAASAGQNGGSTAAGNRNHSHTIASHNHTTQHTHISRTGGVQGATIGIGTVYNQNNYNPWACPMNHTHSWRLKSGCSVDNALGNDSDSTDSLNPPYSTLGAIENAGASDVEERTIALWIGIVSGIPHGWALCDGRNNTPNLLGRYIKCANLAAEIGSIGGSSNAHEHTVSNQHTHSGTHQHSYAYMGWNGPLVDSKKDYYPYTIVVCDNTSHIHNVSGGQLSGEASPTIGNAPSGTLQDETNEPLHIEVAFIMYTAEAALEPPAIAQLTATFYGVQE